MNRADIQNGGYRCRSAFALLATAVAAGTGDNTEASGPYADRLIAGKGHAQSAKLIISYSATLAADKTLSITASIQDNAANSGNGTDFGAALAKTVVATGASGGSTETGTIELDFDISSAERYVRAQITPDLSATATDTATISAAWVFFGAENGPISKSLV